MGFEQPRTYHHEYACGTYFQHASLKSMASPDESKASAFTLFALYLTLWQ